MNRRELVRSFGFRAAALVLLELLAGKFNDGDKIKINAHAHKFTFEKT